MALEKLVISCGGTGGHFYPGLSVARCFISQGKEVLLLLSGAHAVEQQKIAERSGVNALALPEMPHYRKNPFRFVKGFSGGYFAAKKELKNFGAQALLGMGSFATLPVVLAAVRNHVPLFLHDGNARIGKANRLFSRWAKLLGSAFPAVNASSCRCKVLETGMPLRPELLAFAGMDKAAAVEAVNEIFGTDFSGEQPLILVTGGSQGAAVFNKVLPEVFCGLKKDFQVIHLTGKGKMDDTAGRYEKADFPYLLQETTGNMAEVLAASDLVFSRSGGSTAAELALFGKPAVLIPYPFAAEGHQLDNARHFADNGGAELVENPEFTVEKAAVLLKSFLEEPEKWQQMGETMRRLGKPDAAGVLLQEISAALDFS